jgi:hypothetical protein
VSFIWSEEAVERLKALHAQGLSGSALASRLGGGLTRSAIFGKLHRLGLTGKNAETQRRLPLLPIRGQAARGLDAYGSPDRRGDAHGTGPMKFNFMRKRPKGQRASEAPGVGDGLLPPPSRRIGIVDIGRDQCPFIEGDDGLACGHPVAPGSSWCSAHYRIVFTGEAAASAEEAA